MSEISGHPYVHEMSYLLGIFSIFLDFLSSESSLMHSDISADDAVSTPLPMEYHIYDYARYVVCMIHSSYSALAILMKPSEECLSRHS